MPRRSIRFAGIAGAVLLLGACGGQHDVVTQPAAVQAPAAPVPAAVQAPARAGGSCRTVAPLPGWLPADVTRQRFRCTDPAAAVASARPPAGNDDAADGDDGSAVVSTQPGRTVRTVTYRLRGAKNADTVSGASPSAGEADDPGRHFRTDILFVTYLGARQLPESVADDGSAVSQVTLASGAAARVTTPVTGFGAYRVEWVSGGNAYLLLSSRLSTDQGDSGVAVADLLRMAGSVA